MCAKRSISSNLIRLQNVCQLLFAIKKKFPGRKQAPGSHRKMGENKETEETVHSQ